MRKFGEITPSGSENNTIGFHICNLREKLYEATPMPLLPSDPSGKSDIALKYKQRNKSQQSDPLRLLFFLL